MSAVVHVEQLRKRFGSAQALDGVTWSARAATVTAVLGPNGAGKTTMVEILEGLQRADDGVATVLGTKPWGASARHRARVGVMLQDGGLPARARPLDLLNHLAHLYADPVPVAELGHRLGIDAFAKTITRRMSGGQRQRVALAAALIGRPDVLFLDEPTAGLDPHARLDVWELIRDEADRGVTVVVTTHSFEEAERLADHVVIMHRGAVVGSGTVTDLTKEDTLETVYFARTGRNER
ncbi:MAG: ABC transporter ATP-binding protein [Nostocoides sp.]